MPVFWLALLLQILFVDIYLKWNVRIFYTSRPELTRQRDVVARPAAAHRAPGDHARVISFALYSRYMRASMLDVINTDYVRTARAKGVPERRVIMRHVVPERADPPRHRRRRSTSARCSAARSSPRRSSGSTGSAPTSSTSSDSKDVYAVMAYLMVTAVIIIVFNLIADILYGFLDPRIRYD